MTAPDSHPIIFRPATIADMPRVAAIYNHYVRESTVTFDETESTVDSWRERFAETPGPFLVAELGSEICGYALVSPWKTKSAFRFTVEDSIYLHPEFTGRGIGPALLERLVEAAAAAGLRRIIAVITEGEGAGSVSMHRRAGFRDAGSLPDVGLKFGRWLGVTLMIRDVERSSDA